MSDNAPEPNRGSNFLNNQNLPPCEWRNIGDLRPYGRELKQHPKKQMERLTASISALGFLDPPIIDEDNRILSGVARVAAARALGMDRLPVVVARGLSATQKRAFVIAANRIGELGKTDRSALAAEFAELKALEFDLAFEVTGYSEIEVETLALSLVDLDEPRFKSPDAVAVSYVGAKLICGDNVVVCGDATSRDARHALMGSASLAQMVFIDPPWNVPTVGHITKNQSHRDFVMASGEMSNDQFTAFLRAVLENVAEAVVAGGLIYVVMDGTHLPHLFDAGRQAGLSVFQFCHWVKPNGGQGSFYRSRSEEIVVFKKGSAKHKNRILLGSEGRHRTNVWEYPGYASLRLEAEKHPTPKPVELIRDAILDSTDRGDLIVDFFSGGGSTLIAAEQSGRPARIMELDPLYVDATVERWQAYTGRDAVFADTGLTYNETRAAQDLARRQANAPQPTTRMRLRTRPEA